MSIEPDVFDEDVDDDGDVDVEWYPLPDWLLDDDDVAAQSAMDGAGRSDDAPDTGEEGGNDGRTDD